MVNGEGRQRMHLMIFGLALLAHEVLRLALRVEVVHLRSSSVNGDVCDDRCLGHQSRITSEAHARCANQRVYLLRQRALAHTMPMAMFIISTAAGSGASEGTPIKERSASTFCAKLMRGAITDESARI